jgi:tetratricopeptide (TPR) repeat protein
VAAFLGGYPVSARSPSALYVAGKFMRRHRAGTALASLALVAVLTSAAYATWQAQRAEARFADLRQLAHAVLFDYHDLVEPMVGATPVRKRLVLDALTYLDRLSQHAPADRALRREMGIAYRVVGLVQRNGYRRPHLGDTAGALRSYERSIELLEALAAESPSDAETTSELALALSARAGVWGEDGNMAAARPALERAASLYTGLLERDTPDLAYRLELARTHLRLAQASIADHDMLVTEAALKEARRVLVSMAALQPDNKELPHVWVWVHGEAAGLARLQGDWANVRREKLRSYDILMTLHKADPDNARYLEDLASNARWLLATAGPLRDVAAAERWGNEASERIADLAKRDPDDRITRGNYLDTLIASGVQLVRAGAPESGWQRLVAVRQPLIAAVARWGDDPDMRAREPLLLVAEAQAEAALGRVPSAHDRFTQAAALAGGLTAAFPGRPILQTCAAIVSFSRAKLLVEQALLSRAGGPRAQARQAMVESLAQLESLLQRKALVPAARASHIDEARELLRQLDA